MYAAEGRPAVNAVVLALVSISQFPEKLPDRAAAEAAIMRLDWKYALRQELTWTGFHYSDLCNFRKQLLEHGRPQGFRLQDSQIDVEQRQAICPAGKKQVKWARAKPGVKNLQVLFVAAATSLKRLVLYSLVPVLPKRRPLCFNGGCAA